MTATRGFGIYVHWPFCQAKCPYCDFNSHVSANIDHEAWAKAYVSEIERAHHDIPDATLNSVFFGGGTPSLMDPRTIEAILEKICATWTLADDLEVTIEANPTSVEADRFSAYASAGVNRVSIGVQSLNDADLRRLGRLHSADEARKAVETANAHFQRMSFDLIYARQDQSMKAWEAELSEALTLSSGHLSLYQLTIEPGTAFGDRFERGGLKGLPEEELAADLYTLTQELTTAAGLHCYEISNHARPGLESKHNLIYWRGHDWLGIGPGAHGRFNRDGQRIATETHLMPNLWMEAVRNGNGESERRKLTEKDDFEERLMMGLRLTEGIILPEDTIILNKINDLSDIGVLEYIEDRVRPTDNGRLVLNSIIRELLS